MAYIFPSPQEVGLIADAEKNYVRPTDLTCSFLLPREMENEYLFSSFVRHLCTVRSLRPVQVLSFDDRGYLPASEAVGQHIPQWERSIVGYNADLLRQLATKLKPSQEVL